jgi:hypothetical protein
VFHTVFEDIVVVGLHTIFHIPRSNGSLVIAVTPGAILCYIL